MAEVSLGGTEIVMADKANVSRPELIAEAQRSNGLVITLSEPLDADFFRAVSDGPLRVVSTMSTGIDHIDLLAAHAAGITVARLPATVTAAATAELTWALVLGVARGLVPARADLLDGHWGRWNPWQWNGVELAGATFGIVGYGAIGQRVARYAAAFDMQVLIATRTPPSALDPGAQLVTMDELAARSDVISLHVPLTPDTALMVDTPFLAGVKHGAILINASRGGIVDEPALIQALDEGRLAGAGLDVHAIEPAAPDAPLVRHPKVLALPHMGSATTRTRATMAAEAVKGALDGLSE
ncbi:MAG: D-glycerate dehydrogenase [Frankiales bacterium]|nr:D-glycerate dehydrogenase [Frankiales bacterium]